MELSAVHYSADIPLRGTKPAVPWLFVTLLHTQLESPGVLTLINLTAIEVMKHALVTKSWWSGRAVSHHSMLIDVI